MAFVNYGLDWDREPGPHGRMWGKARAGDSGRCDFHPQIGIYILKRKGEDIYVGRSGTGERPGIGGRLVSHAQDKDWDQFSWFGIRPVGSSGLLTERPVIEIEAGQLISDVEAVLIYSTKLKSNKVSGTYKHMTEYFQVP